MSVLFKLVFLRFPPLAASYHLYTSPLAAPKADKVAVVPEQNVVPLAVGGVGSALTVKVAALEPVPAGVVTDIVPEVADGGTVAVIWVALTTVKPVETPLNVTDVAPVKLVPVMVTNSPEPIQVFEGKKLVTVGNTGGKV